MTEGRINLRCDEALAQAQQLRAQAASLEDAKRQLERELEELESYWEGEESRVFAQKARQRMNKMQGTSKRLHDLAEAITKTAQIYRRNELAKLAAAKSRR